MTQAQSRNALTGTIVSPHRTLVPGVLLGLALMTVALLGSTSLLAVPGQPIFCAEHGGAYGPAHFRHHDDGYVLTASNGYRFYPRASYGTLAVSYYGAPAVYLSGGYFYPLQVGYGPVYEPTGYFEIYAGRYGRTSLGLRIGIGALPTVGFGYLGYHPRVVRYAPPPWAYGGGYVRFSAPPHVHYYPPPGHGRIGHGAGHHPPAKRHFAREVRQRSSKHKWQKSTQNER